MASNQSNPVLKDFGKEAWYQEVLWPNMKD